MIRKIHEVYGTIFWEGELAGQKVVIRYEPAHNYMGRPDKPLDVEASLAFFPEDKYALHSASTTYHVGIGCLVDY